MKYQARKGWRYGAWVGLVVVTLVATGSAEKPQVASSQDRLWRRTVALVQEGAFDKAEETIARVTAGGPLTERVRAWLEEYEKQQEQRRRLDKEEFDKYVGYAKARVERKEYSLALGWALAALDCTHDREAFLQSEWLQALVGASLEKADGYRKEHKWRKAWRIYSQLAALYETEPRYQRLEHEALTHLRLDRMFTKDSHWDEAIKQARWKDAERALRYIEDYYVKPPDFKAIAEHGLEQVLILADSSSARETFKGLQDDEKRNEFKVRVQEHLDQVRAADAVDRRTCVNHFRRVVKVINRETVRFPESLLVSELMRGALDPLDDFTTIIWPRESKEFEKHTRGDFVGVGISIIKNRADEIEVVTPLEDTPAYRAGIQAGDVIVSVDGKPLEKDISINQVVDIITGPKGTYVTLGIRRGDQHLEFTLQRDRIKIRSVKGIRRRADDEEKWDHWLDRELGIGYIRVTNFQKNTVEDMVNALSELKAGGLKGLVLDLRGNPGGLLDSAWQMSSLFLKRGDKVVETRGRLKREDAVFRAPSDGPYSDLPLVVLVDDRSASASEIVSGSTRDNGRATVIGERTFGKFSVQNLITLGRTGAKLKITTARYYLPSGVSLQREPGSKTWGVEPDIPVRLTRWERYNVYQMQREANLLGPPKPKTDDDKKKDEDDESKAKEEDKGSSAKEDAGPDAKEKEGAEKKDEKSDDDSASADEEDEDDGENKDLPPLKQPDENNRPKRDPQLDTALLYMRIRLLGESYPTLAAAAEAMQNAQTRNP